MALKVLTVEKAFKIIDSMYEQISLKGALDKHDVNPKSFYALMKKTPEIEEHYLNTKLAVAEHLITEIVEIADNDPDPMRAKNRIHARQWLAAKLMPKTYGDRIDLNITETVDLKIALDDARNRIRPVCDLKNTIETQARVLIENSITPSTGYESVGEKDAPVLRDAKDISIPEEPK